MPAAAPSRQGSPFLTKPIEEQTLLQAIESAQTRLDQQAERNEARQSLRGLTEREREVLELITKGLGGKDRSGARYIGAHRGHAPRQAGRKAGHGLGRRTDKTAADCGLVSGPTR
jgi:hypothetical protein